ncbi:unnamed protein product [Closterium sp. Naga37s-1]|nr:unnamed protein product [Closterium sp. Naga37s-1]
MRCCRSWTDARFPHSNHRHVSCRKWRAGGGCDRFRERFSSHLHVDLLQDDDPASWPPNPSLQPLSLPECPRIQQRHVSVRVQPPFVWFGQRFGNRLGLEGTHTCAHCGLTCTFSWEAQVVPRPDVLLFVRQYGPLKEAEQQEMDALTTRPPHERPLLALLDPEAAPEGATVPGRQIFSPWVPMEQQARWDVVVGYHRDSDVQITYVGMNDDEARKDLVSNIKLAGVPLYRAGSHCSVRWREAMVKDILRVVRHHSFGRCQFNMHRISELIAHPTCRTPLDKWTARTHCVESRYKFAIAVENSERESYATEKLFIPFDARTVPVYYGAPDVAHVAAPGSFIDMRAFPNKTDVGVLINQLHANAKFPSPTHTPLPSRHVGPILLPPLSQRNTWTTTRGASATAVATSSTPLPSPSSPCPAASASRPLCCSLTDRKQQLQGNLRPRLHPPPLPPHLPLLNLLLYPLRLMLLLLCLLLLPYNPLPFLLPPPLDRNRWQHPRPPRHHLPMHRLSPPSPHRSHKRLRLLLAPPPPYRLQLPPAAVASNLAAMEAMPADDAAPETGPDEPPLPAKPTAPSEPEKSSDRPRSGLDFLRATAAPVAPEPPRSIVHDSAAIVTPAPSDSPCPVAFTPKRARSGKFSQSTLVVGGRRIPPPEKPAEPPQNEAELPEEGDIPVRADTGSPALTKAQLREQMYLEASINYETKWAGYFSWLVFGKTKDGFPYVKCSICMSYGKGNTRYAMQGDDGGHDLQTQSFRAHEHTDAHKAAVDRQMKIAAGIHEGQQVISDFINSDIEGRRAIRLMRSTQFLCQCDAPISMFPRLMRHLAEQDTPDIPRQSEALAVKDAADSNPDLGMVDKVVRTVATLLGNSSVWSQRFKYLQRVIYKTNLEVQGIHTVRWLSRGDAVGRLCKVLGACIVLLWEHNHKAYEIVTCYKFQFCLFFLADILADMNDLNRCFQRRELDVTEIAKTIESTTGDLTERYLTPEKAFGGEGKSWLVNFLKVHKEGGGKQVRVRGVDGAGRPINHLYTMHERKLKGHKHGSTYADCVKLCRKFARDCVDNLNDRLDDLGKLELFRAGKWPKIKAQREKKCKEWLNGCSRLFRNKLPGFDLKAAERELPTFCAIMETHYEMESFIQGLSNFLGSADSKRSLRRRRPAKSLKLAVAERGRKVKQKEGEDVAAGNAGENEDEGEEEEDDEVEQAFGDDQEIVGEEEEAEDNPFLSDDEDVEEVYFRDRTVH